MNTNNNFFLIRSLDIIFSILGLSISLPILALIAIAGSIETGSPLFLQKRVGRNKESFTLIKFRTMKIGTSSVPTHLASNSSITPLGKLLRGSKLDELPQLLNVLAGDMSLVGPRPGLSSHSELTHEREVRCVFQTRPGITGLAQVNNIDMSNPRKLARYDSLMINKMGLPLYLKLIALTVLGKGAGDKTKSKLGT